MLLKNYYYLFAFSVVGLKLQQIAMKSYVQNQLADCYNDNLAIDCYLLDDGGFLIYSANEDRDKYKVCTCLFESLWDFEKGKCLMFPPVR